MLNNSITQATLTESAISYSVSLSCVLGNRLCLNVRGMVWQDDDIMVGGQWSLEQSKPRAMRENRSYRIGGGTRPQYSVMVVSRGRDEYDHEHQLSEFEMDELRSMRPDDLK